jgi:hypothetical protein
MQPLPDMVVASTVHFDRCEMKPVKIEDDSRSDDSDYDNDWFRYLLSTASAWKGPIQKGRVTIKLLSIESGPIVIQPAGLFSEDAGGKSPHSMPRPTNTGRFV